MITNFPDKKIYNLGGYTSFVFSPIQFIAGVQRSISANAPIALVSFLGGYDWLSGYATMQSLAYTEEPKTDDNGTYYDLTIAGFIPGDKPELEQVLADMEQQRHLVVLKDPAGILRLVGTDKQPLTFLASYSSGAARSDQKGYTFKFSGTSSVRAPQFISR